MNRGLYTSLALIFLGLFAWGRPAILQKPPDSQRGSRSVQSEETRYYKRWLEDDVRYIISDEEESVFEKLTTSEEQERFIEDFWRRRDPSPETFQNEFKEEHYRRIAYANEHFASGKSGWLTDRGRIYITHGPPDRKETNPTGTQLIRSEYEGGNMTTHPFSVWEYRYLEGVGPDVTIEFVDKTGTNNYEIALNDNEKDALFMLTGSHIVTGDEKLRFVRAKDMPFERLETYTNLTKPPPAKFKHLEEAVTARVTYKQLPVRLQENYLRLTDESILTAVAIEIENRHLSFEGIGEVFQASVNLYGRVTDISKRVVEAFEDIVKTHLSRDEVKKGIQGKSVYQKKMALRPGRYILELVVEDPLSGRKGSIQQLLIVLRFEQEKLSSSSLILAVSLAPVTNSLELQSQFVLGDLKVIPNVERIFQRGDRMGVYLQVYNVALDQAQLKPAVEVSATVRRGKKTLKRIPQSELSIRSSGQQITFTTVVDTAGMEPGPYVLEVNLVDMIANENLVRLAPFTVK